MNKILKFELKNLVRQKSFYLCTAVILFLLSLTNITLGNSDPEMKALLLEHGTSGISMMIRAVSDSYFLMIAGIFVALFVCNDFEQNTIKNVYSRGYSPAQVFISKAIVTFAAVTIMYVLTILLALAEGTYFFSFGTSGALPAILIMFIQYLACMANICFYYMLCMILKKSGASISAILISPLMINLVLAILDSRLKLNHVTLSSLWLGDLLSNVSTLNLTAASASQSALQAVCYIIFCSLIGFVWNKRYLNR